MSLLVHSILLAFLWIGVSWQSVTPVAVEAEIWNISPQEAAPPPPPEPVTPQPAVEPKPSPPPVKKLTPKPVVEPKPVPTPEAAAEPKQPKIKSIDPDIALEKEKKRKQEQHDKELAEQLIKEKLAEEKAQKEAELERKKLAEEKAQKEADLERKKLAEEKAQKEAELERKKLAEEKAQKEAELERKKRAEEQRVKQEQLAAAKRAQRHEEDMKRLNSQLNTATSTGTTGNAEKSQGSKGDDGYGRRVAALIKSNTVLPPLHDISTNPPVIFEFQLLPDGSPREITLVKSSGIGAFDEAVKRAIEKTLFPPDPASGKVPSDRITIRHRPKD
jgi:colicin import membrane protein